jgi:hypothetical protein
MNKSSGALALGVAAILGSSTAALASEQTYRIDANSQSTIDLNVCSSSVYLEANGDDDTDLDFWLYDNFGNLVHSDTDGTDLTFYTISNGNAGGGRCLPYRLEVHNLGNIYNNMVLSLTDQGATSGGGQTGIYASKAPVQNRVVTQSVRSEAGSSQNYTLNLCAPSVYLEVRGDGDTDLDFWVYDDRGREVHSDTDGTDITFATLNSGRSTGSCAEFSLRIHNYGNVYNQVEIKLTEQ